MNADATPLLELRQLKKYYPVVRGLVLRRTEFVKAVDGVSLQVLAGTTYSLVGESGAGKSTVGRLALGLDPPDSGSVLFGGRDVSRHVADYRSSISAVFQDPWGSLNPRMTVRDVIAEPLLTHQQLSRAQLRARVDQLMELVGLSAADGGHYPHEFSGGQRQRVAIARAVSTSPRLVLLDEPVSSLDVSIKAQIMNLLKALQLELGIAYLLIAHDLGTVRFLSHKIGVMYLGKIVEEGDVPDLFTSPLHPYTRALIAASMPPRPGFDDSDVVASGDIPSPETPPAGCSFHPRCPMVFDPCPVLVPLLEEREHHHIVACHLYSHPQSTPDGQ